MNINARRTKLSPHPPCSIARCVKESPNRTIFSRRDVNPMICFFVSSFCLRATRKRSPKLTENFWGRFCQNFCMARWWGELSLEEKKTKSVQLWWNRVLLCVVKNVNNKENIITVIVINNNNNKRGTVLATTRGNLAQFEPVSYTHLTLPTILLV